MRRALSVSLLGITSACLACCIGIPYVGTRSVTPARKIIVTDTAGHTIRDYDLYIYRCSHPGSKFSRVFSFPDRPEPTFALPSKSEVAVKWAGGAWLAPDFYVSYEPQFYWIACVNKKGYKSRRWSLSPTQGETIKIVLKEDSTPGNDYCDGTGAGPCNPCKSYEYFMYEISRYRHSDCAHH